MWFATRHDSTVATICRLVMFVLLLSMTNVSVRADELSDGIEKIINRPEFRQAHWGLKVVDAEDGEALYRYNAGSLFAPASVTKLFSVAAAYEAFGADYRFKTPIYTRGKLDAQGVLHGDLILVASGDLTMGGRTDKQGHLIFRNVDHTYASPTSYAELVDIDPLAGLKDLARQVRASGVKEVTGEVLIDDRLFDRAEGTGSGPSHVTPIIVNDNVIDFQITPAKEPGQRANVEWRPHSTTTVVDSQIETVKEGEKPKFYIYTSATGGITLRGSLPVNSPPRVLAHEVDNPARVARGYLVDCLRAADVRTHTSPLRPLNEVTLPKHDEYGSLRRVAQLVSPPFHESAKVILKVSHNLHASTLPLLLAAQQGKRTLNDGMAIEGKLLNKLGVDTSTISFGGGAGGDRADFVTPRAAVQLLQGVQQRPYFDTYLAALPVMGMDGTLALTVKKNSPARGKVQAKTGTLSVYNRLNQSTLLTSKALAGFADCRSGRRVIVAIFVNLVHLDESRDTAAVGRAIGEVCEVIVRHL